MSSSTITSVHNPRIVQAAKLRLRRQRDRQQRMLIDGVREIERALAAGIRFIEVFFLAEKISSPERQALLSTIESRGAEVFEVSPAVFEKVAFGERIEGLVAVAALPEPQLSDLPLPDCPLVAVLEGVEKPGNVGAVLRSADGAGVSALVLCGGGTDLYNSSVIRASLGAVFALPVAMSSPTEIQGWLKKQGVSLVAARVDATRYYTEFDFTRPTAIVLGSEAEGLSDAWLGEEVTPVRLPMLGIADSLNVSAAAAVLFYEALRQRRAAGMLPPE